MVIWSKPLNLQLVFKIIVMAVTRLKRKDRRNKARAHNRIKKMKQLSRRPVIRKIEGAEAPVAEVAVQEEE